MSHLMVNQYVCYDVAQCVVHFICMFGGHKEHLDFV